LRYLRSSFFTVIFFIQKLLVNSSGKNNKNCSVFTRNPTKLGLHFSNFSTIVYRFYKIQPKVKYYLRNQLFKQAPGTFQYFTDMPLIHKNIPGKIGEPAIGSLGTRRRSSPESGKASGAPGRKGGGAGSRAHPSSILLVGWGSLMAGEGARWRSASAAAAAGNSDEAKAELGNTRRGKLLCGPGKAYGGWPATEGSVRWSLARSCQWRWEEWPRVGSAREKT
jgi:hypothetical protein